jgi:hypothetical protein
VTDALFNDYLRFHTLALDTRDVDPVYPVLRHLAAGQGLSAEDRIRLVMRHVAYYHLGSALTAFAGEGVILPCATERRSHRDVRKLQTHLDALRSVENLPGGWTTWFAPVGRYSDRRVAWGALNSRLLEIWGNGRWAAYKTAEMLWKVCGFPVEATDMGHAYSSGPRRGLALLSEGLPTGNSTADIQALNEASERLCGRLRSEGAGASVEEVETTLCDFHSLHVGRYYVGHDIDQMLRQLLDVQSSLTGAALDARSATLPQRYLGEVYGWTGPDRDRCRRYRRTGEIMER